MYLYLLILLCPVNASSSGRRQILALQDDKHLINTYTVFIVRTCSSRDKHKHLQSHKFILTHYQFKKMYDNFIYNYSKTMCTLVFLLICVGFWVCCVSCFFHFKSRGGTAERVQSTQASFTPIEPLDAWISLTLTTLSVCVRLTKTKIH